MITLDCIVKKVPRARNVTKGKENMIPLKYANFANESIIMKAEENVRK